MRRVGAATRVFVASRRVLLLTLEAVSSAARTMSYGSGEMRGGTPALWDDNMGRYAALFHSKCSEHLLGHEKFFATLDFYTFSGTPPFEIEGVVRAPIEPAHLHEHDTATLSCAYPGGFLQRGSRMYVVYGWQDHAIHLLELHSGALYEALERR